MASDRDISDRMTGVAGLRLTALAAGAAMVLVAYSTVATAQSPAGRIELAQATPPAASKSKSRGGDQEGGLQRRIEQLEEQLVDMQVTIGTLESLARSGGGGARNGGGGVGFGPSEAARLEGMETQIRALTAEVQRLSNQLRSGGGSYDRGDAGGPAYGQTGPAAGSRSEARTEQIPSAFGSTTVTAGGDPIGTLIGRGAESRSPEAPAPGSQVAALPPVSSGNAKQDYETAFGYLVGQDYAAAESSFEDFLKSYPDDPLAGSAQYWLGETHFVRGNYKPAASAFLKGYQTYGKSNKAPDSLLKLAMSLDRLGQKDAACSSFGELVTRFPGAESHLKNRAASERKRLGCR
ncbi:MAG: tol-pal system protein YbgF [Hyphomicrobiaceae bacterium]